MVEMAVDHRAKGNHTRHPPTTPPRVCAACHAVAQGWRQHVAAIRAALLDGRRDGMLSETAVIMMGVGLRCGGRRGCYDLYWIPATNAVYAAHVDDSNYVCMMAQA